MTDESSWPTTLIAGENGPTLSKIMTAALSMWNLKKKKSTVNVNLSSTRHHPELLFASNVPSG
jgi:hypothetical protein